MVKYTFNKWFRFSSKPTQYTCEIPEWVKFFYKENEVGACLVKGCEHYTTVVEDNEQNKPWIQSIKNCAEVRYVGKWAIITFENLEKKDLRIPITDREEWFKEHGIDFSKFIIVERDADYYIVRLFRIKNFQDIWNVTGVSLNLRNMFEGARDLLMIQPNQTIKLPWPGPYNRISVREGEDAEILWASAVGKIFRECMYDSLLDNSSYNFDAMHDEMVQKFYGHSKSDIYNIEKDLP